jgi:diphthine-ammonia ligase
MPPLRVVGLVSGGKDSLYNLLEAARRGHSLVCLANLRPGGAAAQELDSFMFQTVGHTALDSLAACMGLPLVRRETSGSAVHTGLEYEGGGAGATAGDEVEDLHALLVDVLAAHPGVNAVSVGAILSSYQRHRVEAVCARLGLTPLALLWQRAQAPLLDDMVAAGLEAVLVKVAAHGLAQPQLGRGIGQLTPALKAAVRRSPWPRRGVALPSQRRCREALRRDCKRHFRAPPPRCLSSRPPRRSPRRPPPRASTSAARAASTRR